MKIYVYDSMTGTRGEKTLALITGRYMALDAEWPYGKIIAFGYTIGGTARKARRRLAAQAGAQPRNPRLVHTGDSRNGAQ